MHIKLFADEVILDEASARATLMAPLPPQRARILLIFPPFRVAESHKASSVPETAVRDGGVGLTAIIPVWGGGRERLEAVRTSTKSKMAEWAMALFFEG